MRTIGATLFMVGLGQAMFQFYLLYTAGYWSAFSLGDFLGRHYYGYGWFAQLTERLLAAEFSLTLLAAGSLLALAGPVGNALRAWHAHRMIHQVRRTPRSTAH